MLVSLEKARRNVERSLAADGPELLVIDVFRRAFFLRAFQHFELALELLVPELVELLFEVEFLHRLV